MQEKIKEQAKIAGKAFIEKNKDMEGEVIESPTGLVMILNKAKDGVTPKSTDNVLIQSTGYFENGNLFTPQMQK